MKKMYKKYKSIGTRQIPFHIGDKVKYAYRKEKLFEIKDMQNKTLGIDFCGFRYYRIKEINKSLTESEILNVHESYLTKVSKEEAMAIMI
ncbi:MAG TPA: hypothetical protein VMV43_10030 [Candidatus Nanopelagicaceae bacterium]|nr:hypothetical protein [Candidatus Nanopelagicaceae bacterium]